MLFSRAGIAIGELHERAAADEILEELSLDDSANDLEVIEEALLELLAHELFVFLESIPLGHGSGAFQPRDEAVTLLNAIGCKSVATGEDFSLKAGDPRTKLAQSLVSLSGPLERGAMLWGNLSDDSHALTSIDKDIVLMELTAGAAATFLSAAAAESLEAALDEGLGVAEGPDDLVEFLVEAVERLALKAGIVGAR